MKTRRLVLLSAIVFTGLAVLSCTPEVVETSTLTLWRLFSS